GFLPAVVVDSVLRPRSGRAARVFVFFAYGVSTAAEALMFWSAGHGVVPSSAALKTLTWSYAAIAIPVLVLTRRGDGPPRRWSVVALAVFAISALHLSHSEGPHEPWFVELVGH